MLAWSTACARGAPRPVASVTRAPFGTTDRGESVSAYTLKSANGMEARVLDYGGIVVSVRVPDRHGRFDDVVLGYDSLADYLRSSPYFGAIIGRYGNRIAGGRFTLDGKTYTLAKNNGPNHLHGGLKGFDKVVWDAAPFQGADSVGLVFRYTSPDGEEGYPGTVRATVTYTLTDRNELIFDYHATTDRATLVNLTQHSYFNLAGDGKGDILGHVVTLNADRFTPVDSTLIPTGEIRSVSGTPFDFRTPTAIGARIDQDDEQLRYGRGYDHNFVLNKGADGGPTLAARVYEPSSGRLMEIYTTEPGLQFYSGNFLDGTLRGKHGVVYRHRYGFAMETQHFPDSPNKPSFPSTTLRPGEQYRSRTIYKFAVQP
ncbi:MAG: galactose-1-epimerase [Gemmatimonadetes bacterium]|nr:MAG: galactose-1-epimerase [Gemmatimonadota bacterium]PYP23360.1 MAG: galactose-1-epimerase [Gemmatimonadota bacterium]